MARAVGMPTSPIRRLRTIGIFEGLSFLILLGVAMPLKYFAGIPEAVKVVGWIHGLLFIALCAALLNAKRVAQWTMQQAGRVVIAALLPFGPFVIDGWLRKEDTALSQNTSGQNTSGQNTSVS